MLLIKNCKICDPYSIYEDQQDILIENGTIKEISPDIAVNDGECSEVIDASGLVAAPGFVDVHTHFRDPGFWDKETIHTGALAAARGGYTSVVCMANTSPAVDNAETLKYVMEEAAKEQIHIYQAAAVTVGRNGEALVDMEDLKGHGAAGFTDDGSPILSDEVTLAAMEKAASLNAVLSFHEEDPAYIGVSGVNDGPAAEALGIKGAGRKAETTTVVRDLNYALKTKCKIDIQHVSAAESVEFIRQAKLKDTDGLIHAEATPNHFTLTEDAVSEYGTLAKINPPLRTEADRQAIINGLVDGTIDIIATDHAPHTSAEKEQEFPKAPSGIIGLETAFSLGFRELVQSGRMTLTGLIALMSTNPANLYSLNAGRIKIGAPADIVLLSTETNTKYDHFESRSSNSPFLGQTLPGAVFATICSGNVVFRRKI